MGIERKQESQPSSPPHEPICEPGAIEDSKRLRSNEARTSQVVFLTLIMMVVEIAAGLWTGSMALFADGWHMAADAGSLGISLLAYRLARSKKLSQSLTFGGGKLLPLAGYTSGLVLLGICAFILIESVDRFFHPQAILFGEAIWVAALGLIVNLVAAWLLHRPHPDHQDHHQEGHDHAHEHHAHGHDHSHKSASLHVLADAVTSVTAIAALFIGQWTGRPGWDSVAGLCGGVLILFGTLPLLRSTALELLDARAEGVTSSEVGRILAQRGGKLLDLHVWRLSPEALACEVVVENKTLLGADAYRSELNAHFEIAHLVIEERLAP